MGLGRLLPPRTPSLWGGVTAPGEQSPVSTKEPCSPLQLGHGHVPPSSGASLPRAGARGSTRLVAEASSPGGPWGRLLLCDATAGERSCAGLLSSVTSAQPPRLPHQGNCAAPMAEAATLPPRGVDDHTGLVHWEPRIPGTFPPEMTSLVQGKFRRV